MANFLVGHRAKGWELTESDSIYFGTKPKNEEELPFVQRNMLWLIDVAKEHVSVSRKEKKVNPKRLHGKRRKR
jgi:hypothetical protein